ncbi:histone acetyltransferase type B catalytic subunit [Scaptodrosophila lebanonensis]|uniref:Histone acetyltransferase type B catalytic subunit n=1 Tax=Drosophila lebanonensis TaxID=7225 RepID=A0A6J2T9E6_DROLE|nr:histone acetyltransferase type B catalytic subunit [Scaptodrosophila lebanonensis]XP_030373491.1 histone acetyltransferase type B catalytic subunit [Scaptodrosophila lebanonensis]
MAQIQEYQDLVLDALETVEFKLIRDKADIHNDALIFHPAMAHQIFGESETIFGYQDLHVRVLYTAGPLHIYLGIEYEKRVNEISGGEIKADDVVATIAQSLPDGCFFINLDEFLKTLDKADKFQPFGEKLSEYTHRSANGTERHFEIYQCDYKMSSFLKFFARLQTFILWFVDAASYIDTDDMQWSYFVCYEKYKNNDDEYQYATAGYTSVYEYYAYPQNKRPRISQMLVLPPFQKLGLATELVQTIYKYYQSQKNVIDITVEDPSEDFQRLRNFVDARLCQGLKSFARTEVTKGFSKEMVREARETFKLNPRQVRKIYELLRLYYTNVHDDKEYKAYRLEVKKRLNAVYYKQLKDIKKMERAKMDTEFLRKSVPNIQQRMEQLQEEYLLVEQDYKNTIQKLSA